MCSRSKHSIKLLIRVKQGDIILKKILAIEDEDDIANLIKIILESTGIYEVKCITDPEMAYAAAIKEIPDAILLDLIMPKINGWQLFHQFRENDLFKNIPIAICTLQTQDFDDMLDTNIKKADGYIEKPFGKRELIDNVNQLLKCPRVLQNRS
jgi:two-component system response regulator VicR